MNWTERLWRDLQLRWGQLVRVPGRGLAVMLVFLLFTVWPMVPDDSLLVREDLVPWTALCCSLMLAILGGKLLPGAHPQLRPRSTLSGQLAQRILVGLVPWIFASLFDLGVWLNPSTYGSDQYLFGLAGTSSTLVSAWFLATALLTVCLGWLAKEEGQTAWNPDRGKRRYGFWIGLTVAALGMLNIDWLAEHLIAPLYHVVASQAGRADRSPLIIRRVMALDVLTAVSFVSCGYIHDHPRDFSQNQRTHQAAGHGFLPYLLALVLPPLGITILQLTMSDEAANPLGIDIFLMITAIGLWRSPSIKAVACLLHELEPVTPAQDPHPGPAANLEPVKGTLRFRPDQVRRNGLSLLWVVPIESKPKPEDQVTPLWKPQPRPRDRHAAGNALFPLWQDEIQTRCIKIQLQGGASQQPLSDEDNQERRLFLYQPFATRSLGRRSWRWEQPRIEAQLVQIENNTEEIELYDQTILIYSTGTLTQLLEVELAQDVAPTDFELCLYAVPQLQDYVPA